jgi:plastocyanin
MTKTIAIFLGAGLLLAALPAAQAADAGTVSGKVVFKGMPPPPRTIPVTTDASACGSQQQSEELVVGPDKGIKYAVVRVMGAKGAAPYPAKPIEIDQKGCKFNPHVLIVPKGANLDILNSDSVTHNIHSHSTANDEFNKNQPSFKKRVSQKFEDPEKVRLSCDVHPWMSGWVVVAEDGLVAVTDASGSFKLAGVPPGTYKLEVWQEKLGTQTKDITVKAGADANVTFELSRN